MYGRVRIWKLTRTDLEGRSGWHSTQHSRFRKSQPSTSRTAELNAGSLTSNVKPRMYCGALYSSLPNTAQLYAHREYDGNYMIEGEGPTEELCNLRTCTLHNTKLDT